MKKCSRCGTEYEHYGQRGSFCRECKRVRERELHALKSEDQKRVRQDKQLQRKRKIAQAIVDYLTAHSCISCGESRIPCLQFDHIDTTSKTLNVSDMVSQGHALSSIMFEISKCRVLCANCHAIHTAEQFGWYKDLNIGV